MRRLLVALALLGCPAATTPTTTTSKLTSRVGPRPEGMDALADPFAERREVSSEPALWVRGAGCAASLFVGPKACFVRGARVVSGVSQADDAGFTPYDPEVPFEYWLDCGETTQACEGAMTCACGE